MNIQVMREARNLSEHIVSKGAINVAQQRNTFARTLCGKQTDGAWTSVFRGGMAPGVRCLQCLNLYRPAKETN